MKREQRRLRWRAGTPADRLQRGAPGWVTQWKPKPDRPQLAYLLPFSHAGVGGPPPRPVWPPPPLVSQHSVRLVRAVFPCVQNTEHETCPPNASISVCAVLAVERIAHTPRNRNGAHRTATFRPGRASAAGRSRRPRASRTFSTTAVRPPAGDLALPHRPPLPHSSLGSWGFLLRPR